MERAPLVGLGGDTLYGRRSLAGCPAHYKLESCLLSDAAASPPPPDLKKKAFLGVSGAVIDARGICRARTPSLLQHSCTPSPFDPFFRRRPHGVLDFNRIVL